MVARKVSPPNRKITPSSTSRCGTLPSLSPYFFTAVHAGRIAKTVLSRRRNIAKKSSICFHGKYFLLSNRIPRAASSPVRIATRASTHSPSTLPRMSHGAILTRGLLRMRFTFPETPIVYTYSFASLESRLADGSAANHTGVFTPSPLFLNVSRFKYLCPANAANPIASLLPLRCALLYMCHRHKRQAIAGPPFGVRLLAAAFSVHHPAQFQRAGKRNARLLLRPDVRHIFCKCIFLFFAECPGRLEMIVVDKRVHRVMHVPIIGTFQVRDAHQVKRNRLRLRRIRSAHRRLVASHTVVR